MRLSLIMLAGILVYANSLYAERETLTVKATELPALDVTIEPDGDTRLSIHYKLSNNLDHDIYVFTPILTYDREKKKRLPDPGRVYVSWQANQDKGAIRLSKQLWPIPELLEVYAPEVPYLTRLLPGDSLQENLSIDLPLKIDYPYMSAFSKKKDASVPVQVPAHAVVFAIGYVSGEPGALRLEPTQNGNFTIPYGIGITYQKFVERRLDMNVLVVSDIE